METFHCIHVFSFNGVGIECSTVYRGVLISGDWKRGVPLNIKVSGSFNVKGLELS